MWPLASLLGQLSLDIPSWVGAMSTSQRAVMPCGWGVKAGMVRVWVTGKTALVTHGPYLSALALVLSIIRHYTNNRITYMIFYTLIYTSLQ